MPTKMICDDVSVWNGSRNEIAQVILMMVPPCDFDHVECRILAASNMHLLQDGCLVRHDNSLIRFLAPLLNWYVLDMAPSPMRCFMFVGWRCLILELDSFFLLLLHGCLFSLHAVMYPKRSKRKKEGANCSGHPFVLSIRRIQWLG